MQAIAEAGAFLKARTNQASPLPSSSPIERSEPWHPEAAGACAEPGPIHLMPVRRAAGLAVHLTSHSVMILSSSSLVAGP